MQPRWVDTHVHLDRFDPADRPGIVERAAAAGVVVVAVAVDLESSRVVTGMEGVAGCAVGVHPLHALEWDAGELRELAEEPGVVAIGECGFDESGAGWDAQVRAFRGQCELARAVGLPLILHVDGAGAWERLVDQWEAFAGLTVVRHYFTGDAAQARWHAMRGHYVSFGRPLVRELGLQAICPEYPADRMLIETDSYPLPGRATQPRDVVAVGEAIGRLRGWTDNETRARLLENSLAALPGLARGLR